MINGSGAKDAKKVYLQPFNCKYMSNHLVAQTYFPGA
jgi:hypothetical protein